MSVVNLLTFQVGIKFLICPVKFFGSKAVARVKLESYDLTSCVVFKCTIRNHQTNLSQFHVAKVS
jgi:hypothetical protein